MTKISCEYKTITDSEPPASGYSILIDEVSFMSGHILCECYGVRAELGAQSAEVRYVTTNQGSIVGLIEWLQRGKVPPPKLREAVDGWLAS